MAETMKKGLNGHYLQIGCVYFELQNFEVSGSTIYLNSVKTKTLNFLITTRGGHQVRF